MFNFAKGMFADPEVTKPVEIQPKSINIKDEVKKFAESNSLLVAEVPTLVTFDDESLSTSPMPNEKKKYHQRKKLTASTHDWKNINECIVDLCERNITLLEKANDSLQRKATELLLFVACDSDREFQKDVPSCIPIAYGLKGKSICLETARKMIDVVLDNLHQKGVHVLAESRDGQWAQTVFRDSFNNPLTLYEFNKDCWSRFAKLGKKNLLRYMESFSHINHKNIQGLSKLERFDVGRYRNGNIGFDVHYKLNEDKEEVMFLACYSFCGELNFQEGLKKLKMPMRVYRPELWGYRLDIDGNMLHILGFEKASQRFTENSMEQATVTMDEEAVNLMHDMLNYDALDNVDDNMLEYSINLIHNNSLADCKKIKHLLLNTHKFILEQFLILLLCLEEDKWKAFEIEDLYNDHMSSTDMLYKMFLSKELSQLLNIVKEISPKNFRFPKCENKVDKANTLGYILGHYDRVNMKRKKLKSMKTLREICSHQCSSKCSLHCWS